MKALSNNLLTTSSELYDYSEFIVIENNDEKNFKVSQDLLCRYSPGFAKIFNLTRTYQVKDVSITTFEYFATWLQQQPYWDKTWMDHENSLQEQHDRLTEQDKQRGILYLEPTPDDIPDNGEDVWYMALPIIKLYLFATAYYIPLLQRDTIDRLVWCCATTQFDFEAAEEIHFVYRNTVHGSPLRKVLVDAFCCTKFDAKEDRESLLAYPKQFLVDAMFENARIFDEVAGGYVEDMRDPCEYHGYGRKEWVGRCESRVSWY
jgi:hypothetical protein